MFGYVGECGDDDDVIDLYVVCGVIVEWDNVVVGFGVDGIGWEVCIVGYVLDMYLFEFVDVSGS